MRGESIPGWVTVDFASPTDDGWKLYIKDALSVLHALELSNLEAQYVEILENDGGADSSRSLAGMWTQWMAAASGSATTTVLASTPLEPFAHQSNAVYGAMLPQPRLRFLLADEPGTGKTIMAGMYIREAQKLGLVRRALIVAPAGLVTKWQYDFERFFGGELRRITSETVQQRALDLQHDAWIVSLELAAVNSNVQQAIRPDLAGWDVVVFDEAHRLTPTAQTFHAVGRLLAKGTPRALLMTATPHRGSEWLFRHLLHLVDPEIYPDPGDDPKAEFPALKPGGVHFLRRMKEDLLARDGTSPLFKGRHATNVAVPLSSVEDAVYRRALELVDEFFPLVARPLARMVYGKRAASSLFALAETLDRRRKGMGELTEAEAELEADPNGDDDASRDEAKVVSAQSLSARKEGKALSDLLSQVRALLTSNYEPSKWTSLTVTCLQDNGIAPGGRDQAVVFTEYADTADWVVSRLRAVGYTAQMYSGRQLHSERDEVRAAFMRGEFQIIVSTDAGNEGIDLQSAHVLANYDIPWSLVRLEQRMGRIHRVGQTRDVELYNLIATGTREGDVLHVLLENFMSAANDLDGQMFDSLSVVGEITGVRYEEWLTALYGDDDDRRRNALDAVGKVRADELRRAARVSRAQESALAEKVDVLAAMTLLQRDLLDRVNPAIVEAFLSRLSSADLLSVIGTTLGPGILQIRSQTDFPPSLGGGKSALVATSGKALREASLEADVSRVSSIGPGEPAFVSLLGKMQAELEADLYRGGAVKDPTSVTPYDLFAFSSQVRENDGRTSTPWAALVRVDESGLARLVRWEALANLVPTRESSGGFHPARTASAAAAAASSSQESRLMQHAARAEWFSSAKKELLALPINLTKIISDRESRLALRHQLTEQAALRLSGLEQLSQVEIDPPKLVAQVHVMAAGVESSLEEKDSERISMLRVRDLLRIDGWQVTDVASELRGYDILATRGNQQRCVEVKGVWESAGSTGIRMTGNEVLIATQQRETYWLYVVDNCHDGIGTLFGSFPDPVQIFRDDMKADAIFRVPGSSLTAAQED